MKLSDSLDIDSVTIDIKFSKAIIPSNVNESIPDIKLKDLLNDGEAKTLDLSVLKNLKAIIDKAIANYQEHSDKEYKIDIEENNGERVTWIKAKQTNTKIDITSFGTISRYSDSIKSDVYREYSEKLKGKTYPAGATLVKYLITKAFEESSSQSSFEKNVAKYFKFKIK